MLVSMDVTSLYTNIPQEEGINIVCKNLNKPPIATLYLRDMLRLILKDISFHFNGKNYLQTQDMVPHWEQKWQSLLPTFSWPR